MVRLAAKVLSLLSFRRQYSMQAALCEGVAKVYGPDGGKRGTARLVSAERDGYFADRGTTRSDHVNGIKAQA